MKVGDRVIVKWCNGEVWRRGIVWEVDTADTKQPYRVKEDCGDIVWPELNRISALFTGTEKELIEINRRFECQK